MYPNSFKCLSMWYSCYFTCTIIRTWTSVLCEKVFNWNVRSFLLSCPTLTKEKCFVTAGYCRNQTHGVLRTLNFQFPNRGSLTREMWLIQCIFSYSLRAHFLLAITERTILVSYYCRKSMWFHMLLTLKNKFLRGKSMWFHTNPCEFTVVHVISH